MIDFVTWTWFNFAEKPTFNVCQYPVSEPLNKSLLRAATKDTALLETELVCWTLDWIVEELT